MKGFVVEMNLDDHRLERTRSGSARARRTAWRILFGVVVAAAIVGVYREMRWKRFSTVVEGRIYRSGLLKEWQLDRAISSHGLKTVICLTPIAVERERALCHRRGIEFLSFDMHSSGSGRTADYAAVVRTMSDPLRQPVLVHCEAGVARTGAATALYRMSAEGWSFGDALAELKSFERHGRCSTELQELIRRVYRDELSTVGTASKASGPL